MNLSGEPRLAAFKILSYEGMLINCSQSILFFAIIIYYNITYMIKWSSFGGIKKVC